MNLSPKGAVLLIRVSDPKQEREGLSLDNQQQVLRQYALDHGFEVVREFRFQETADLKIRRRFHEMVSYVSRHRSIHAVIAFRVDRMTRNYHDHVLLDELRLNGNKELHFVHDRLTITATTVGRDIQDWDTKVYLAKMHLNRLKEDAVITANFKLSRGERPGAAPYGYRNTKREGKSWIAPEQGPSEVVPFCYDRYSTAAYSMRQVREQVEAKFGVKLSQGRLDFILRNPFYYGEMLYKGKLYPHIYEPLISRELFDKVQEVKRSFGKHPHKYAGVPFAYRGLITCARCGHAITPESRTKGGKTYIYYHCTQYSGRHDAAYIREEDLASQFGVLLKGLTIPEDQLGKIVAVLKQSHSRETRASAERRSHVQAEYTKYEQRIEVLYEDRLDRTISKEFYAERKSQYEHAMRDLEERLKEIDETDECYYQNVAVLLELASRAAQLFNAADAGRKRELIKMLLQDCTLNEKTLVWKLKSPFHAVFARTSCHSWGPLTTMFRNRDVALDIDSDELSAIRAFCKSP